MNQTDLSGQLSRIDPSDHDKGNQVGPADVFCYGDGKEHSES